ncbi:hypothetical protein GUITHDRAFT_138977 [Guillardia theta CCMP2712]|uniref:DNA replication complex GINS protein SLD5 n=1 Tax=Guillardia theta (strain CCMP2712) TaxID=905079 RepID=L1JAS1_GUITC|nr:hypothetical protein GUITHDRAFT_138977 [Guillardia theta CCMP2712]EKX45402.1 hypothetical protein GUITHDRAFT_138977 [Guillardia theta CCMP2712]|eukprot:XP_005832382.1 hypothetical protein GUITHDRAFT_138977 [Guillardia theta CCMP2712]
MDYVNNDDDQTSYDLLLKRVWRNERCSPTLLPYEKELVETVDLAIKDQDSCIEELRKMSKDSTTDFMISLLELELDRLNSYHRDRLKKIQQFHAHLLANKSEFDMMSPLEQKFCEQFTDLFEKHFNNCCFLSGIPEKLQKLNLQYMIVKPEVDNHVFVHVLEDLGDVQVGDAELEMNSGDFVCMKFSDIASLVEQQKVELV